MDFGYVSSSNRAQASNYSTLIRLIYGFFILNRPSIIPCFLQIKNQHDKLKVSIFLYINIFLARASSKSSIIPICFFFFVVLSAGAFCILVFSSIPFKHFFLMKYDLGSLLSFFCVCLILCMFVYNKMHLSLVSFHVCLLHALDIHGKFRQKSGRATKRLSNSKLKERLVSVGYNGNCKAFRTNYDSIKLGFQCFPDLFDSSSPSFFFFK